MNNSFSNDPYITLALIKLEDMLNEQRETPHPDFANITTHKDEVLARYQPIFSLEKIKELNSTDFQSFLLFKNNHHWTQLNRVQKHIVEDMDLLRQALTILLEESHPIGERLNELRPERYWGQHSMVSHLGMPVLTAILQVVYPEQYGVWNNTSDAGLKAVRLWEKDWENMPAGNAYELMNSIYLYLAQMLKIDLWTLDALWWMIKK